MRFITGFEVRRGWILVLVPALLLTVQSTHTRGEGGMNADGYRYLNRMREAAGMVPLAQEARLERAAQSHAEYLAANRAVGHYQRLGRRGFTGETPGKRALHVRFPHGGVSENVSEGDKDVHGSIDGLMGAIYHRLGFLDFDVDQVGMGMVSSGDDTRFVYNMSLSGMTALCTNTPAAARFTPPGRYAEPCAEPVRIRAEALVDVQQSIRRRNPRVVLWPPHQAAGIPPVFYEESPDPLPDLSFSGYPLSIQFNPALVSRVRLLRFEMFEHRGALNGGAIDERSLLPIGSTRLLSASSDPHGKITPLEFALFPLERLEWGTTYVGQAVVDVDGKRETHRWHFTTRDPGAPLVRLAGKGELVPIRPGRPYTIYLPPGHGRPNLAPFSYRHSQNVDAGIETVDQSTLRLKVTGAVCETLEFSSRGGSFTLKLAHKDTLAGPQPDDVLYKGCGQFAADYRIEGKGERLPFRSGVTYRVYLAKQGGTQRLGGVRWRYPQGVRVKLDYLPGDLLAVTVQGRVCQRVEFSFGNGGGFIAQLSNRDAIGDGENLAQALAGCVGR